MGEPDTVPGLSGWNSSSARDPVRAAAIPASEISNAMPGGGSCNRDLRRSSSMGTRPPYAHSFDAETQRRGDLEDFDAETRRHGENREIGTRNSRASLFLLSFSRI